MSTKENQYVNKVARLLDDPDSFIRQLVMDMKHYEPGMSVWSETVESWYSTKIQTRRPRYYTPARLSRKFEEEEARRIIRTQVQRVTSPVYRESRPSLVQPK